MADGGAIASASHPSDVHRMLGCQCRMSGEAASSVPVPVRSGHRHAACTRQPRARGWRREGAASGAEPEGRAARRGLTGQVRGVRCIVNMFLVCCFHPFPSYKRPTCQHAHAHVHVMLACIRPQRTTQHHQALETGTLLLGWGKGGLASHCRTRSPVGDGVALTDTYLTSTA